MLSNTLSLIGDKLNENNITWAVGASILLNQFNLTDKPNDIDILVSVEDIDKVDSILKSMGRKKSFENTNTYSTKYFNEYVINSIDVDIMAGLAINHCAGVFNYMFDESSITDTHLINGITIPFTSLEDWYVLYQLIPNREYKVKLIEDFILSHGLKHRYLLQRNLDGSLPKPVKNRIEWLLLR